MKSGANTDLYRKLPSVDELLRAPAIADLIPREGQAAVTQSARVVLSRLREEIATGLLDAEAVQLALSGIEAAVEQELRQSLRYSLRNVINATGVILHTNLGRAPLAHSAMDHTREVATGYANLEFDTETGERGKRDVHVDRLFRKLLSGEPAELRSAGRARAPVPALAPVPTLSPVPTPNNISTIVVNNNAAAVLLALNTLAEGGEVIVSRGELIEIGGSFRIPDVMAKSRAILREVGTTNRTRIADYERAINENTRLLLRVHRSNFHITGFTEQPRIDELVAVARTRNIPLIEDLGSGALFDLRSIGVSGEPGVLDSLQAGVDVVTYSGDKLLGGPQAGILTGRADFIARMRSNSLFRALRVDKLTYAALEATLLAYVKRDHDAVPALRMLRLSKEEIGKRADAVAEKIRSTTLRVDVIDGESVIGGGAAPSAVLPTRVLAASHKDVSADEVAARLRACDPPIIARVEEGRVLLDLRTVFAEQDPLLIEAIARIESRSGKAGIQNAE
ncbi:MAG TPA: L-seryl-tRNA(Sec) selenium transferase [Terriglobales bacterium]|nr:L-seryl-tRNA(Sec) selenium transferase [Terriglobales bacterium]